VNVTTLVCESALKFREQFESRGRVGHDLSGLDNPNLRQIGFYDATDKHHVVVPLPYLKGVVGHLDPDMLQWVATNLTTPFKRTRLFGPSTEEGSAWLESLAPTPIRFDVVSTALRGTTLPPWFVDELLDMVVASGLAREEVSDDGDDDEGE
jgi:hypothetical protein